MFLLNSYMIINFVDNKMTAQNREVIYASSLSRKVVDVEVKPRPCRPKASAGGPL